MTEETAALLALLNTPGVGCVTAQRVLAVARLRKTSLAEIVAAPPRKLAHWLPSGWERLAEPIRASRAHHDRAKRLIEAVRRAGGVALHTGQALYPDTLTASLGEQAPPLLFCRGDTALLHSPLAAVVGTRTPSPRGERIARAATAALCEAGAGIVSGGADGIDTVAHTAALDAESCTAVVLPQGILTYRAPDYLQHGIENGRAVIVSQFSPAAAWATHAAVTRNATIAAFARLVCVVEPHREGGSMRTGRCGLGQRKAVFCAPRDGTAPALMSAGAQPLADARGALRRTALLAAWQIAPAPPAELFS